MLITTWYIFNLPSLFFANFCLNCLENGKNWQRYEGLTLEKPVHSGLSIFWVVVGALLEKWMIDGVGHRPLPLKNLLLILSLSLCIDIIRQCCQLFALLNLRKFLFFTVCKWLDESGAIDSISWVLPSLHWLSLVLELKRT